MVVLGLKLYIYIDEMVKTFYKQPSHLSALGLRFRKFLNQSKMLVEVASPRLMASNQQASGHVC